MSITTPVSFYQGERISHPVTVYVQGTSRPRDITGLALKYVIRSTQSTTGSALITKSTANGGIVISGSTTGLATITLTTTDTAGLAPGNYFYSMADTTSNEEAVLVDGALVVLGSTSLP